MNKINKLILGLSSLALVAYGAYKGFSNKEPSKYSIEWIKKLTDKDGKRKEKSYVKSFAIRSMMMLRELGFSIYWGYLTR